MSDEQDRIRLIVSAAPDICSINDVLTALSGGDVASVLLRAGSAEEHEFEAFCEALTPSIMSAGVAAIICDATQIAGRCEADGIYLERNRSQLGDVMARFSPQKIVGCGGIMDKHNALKIGELDPDFLVLGKLGKDIKPEAHPKNLALGEWWAQFVEIPGVVSAGNSIESVVDVAKTGVDFVLAEAAVFGGNASAIDSVKSINELLDAHAPILESAE